MDTWLSLFTVIYSCASPSMDPEWRELGDSLANFLTLSCWIINFGVKSNNISQQDVRQVWMPTGELDSWSASLDKEKYKLYLPRISLTLQTPILAPSSGYWVGLGLGFEPIGSFRSFSTQLSHALLCVLLSILAFMVFLLHVASVLP